LTIIKDLANHPEAIQKGLNTSVVDIPCPDIFKKVQPIQYNDLIHVGINYDGGYVVPNIAGTNNLLSLGLGGNIFFEEDWKNIFPQSKIYGFCDSQSNFSHACFEYVDNSIYVDNNNINDIISTVSDKFFFKMDIEGAEWKIYKSLLNNSLCIGGVMEAHLQLNDRNCENEFLEFLEYIQQSDFEIIHLHFNNLSDNPKASLKNGLYIVWRAIEITLLRKNMCPTNRSLRSNSLTEYNYRNVPWHPEINCVF
jgi:hypothetical protein